MNNSTRNYSKVLEIEEKKENCNNLEGKKEICCEKTGENVKNPFEKLEKSCEKLKPKEKSLCFCKETQKYHHSHNLVCGHPFIIHDDHIDYIVEGKLHFPHDTHCDNHGRIYFH